MSGKKCFILWILCAALMLNTETAAQVVRSKTEYTNDSILAKAQMPNGAIALKDKDLPAEINSLIDDTFQLLYAKYARRGRTEMIFWKFEEFGEVESKFMPDKIRLALREAGWYLLEDKNSQYSLLNLSNVNADLLNAFIIPTVTDCTLILTEIKRFPTPKPAKTKISHPNRKTKGNGIGGGNGSEN